MQLFWEDNGLKSSVSIGPDRPRILVGRVPDCDIRVKLSSVSRRHCVFTFEQGQVMVEDLQSTAGTYKDGQRLLKTAVSPGEVINCGGLMVLLAESDVLSSPSAPQASRDKVITSSGFDDYFSNDAPPAVTSEDALPAAGGFQVDDYFGDSHVAHDGAIPLPVEKPKVPLPEPEPEPEPEPAPSHMACYLLYLDDQGLESERRIERAEDPILIGRSRTASLQIKNPSVSSKHCTVGWSGEHVEVRDLGSSNGTYVNHQRVRRSVLQNGDILACGRFELRVAFIEHQNVAQAEYEEWGDDWSGDEDDLGQPRYHLIYKNNHQELTGLTMGEDERRLAIGSRGCEINITGRDVEDEHCELEWDEGVLIAKDLDSQTGSFIDNEPIEGDDVLRDQEVLVVGRFRLHAVRATSDEFSPPSREHISREANLWASYIEQAYDDLEFLFLDGDLAITGERHELSIWGNGECKVAVFTRQESYEVVGMLDRDLRSILFSAFLKAAFPDFKETEARSGEVPAELYGFQGREQAQAILTKNLAQRSPAYHEVLGVLRAIIQELIAP